MKAFDLRECKIVGEVPPACANVSHRQKYPVEKGFVYIDLTSRSGGHGQIPITQPLNRTKGIRVTSGHSVIMVR